MLEQVLKLNEIIREQSEIIDEMFSLLLQHVTTEDEGMIRVIDMIEDVAEAKALI